MKLTDQTINHKRPFICVHDFVFVLECTDNHLRILEPELPVSTRN